VCGVSWLGNGSMSVAGEAAAPDLVMVGIGLVHPRAQRAA
jgi:hypothetical protein